ncbi:MAG TPA: GMC family oxidoreductase N-terminal domain-containing protein, partial [Rariglobus sp.]
LTVVSNAWANRMVFGGPAGSTRATGVLYTDVDGNSHTATARREVVVAGGAFQSPAFLQRSGVGDPNLLRSIGVPIVANNPQVGLNLHNDFSPLIGVHVLGTPADVAAFMQNIFVLQPGSLGYRGGAFLNFHPLEPNKPADYQTVSYRKYQLFLFGSMVFLPAATQVQYNLLAANNNSLLFAMDDLRFAPSGIVQAPLTSVPTDTPNIFFNTLVDYVPTTAPPDQQWPAVQTTMAAVISAILGFDIINQIVQQMNAAIVARGLSVALEIGVPSPTTLFDELSLGLATYGDIWWHYLVPSLVYGNSGTPAQVAFANALAQLKFFARTVAHIDSHQMGSNAIGAAIDSNLRVVGTSNVRVGDLSATPQAPGGNTAFPAMVIGAVTADRILGLGPV